MCYYPTVVVGSGKSEGHVQNNILAAENQEAELILGKPQSWHGPQPTCCARNAVGLDCSRKELVREGPRQHPVSQECCGLTVLQHLCSELQIVSGKEGNTVYCIFSALSVNSCGISLPSAGFSSLLLEPRQLQPGRAASAHTAQGPAWLCFFSSFLTPVVPV